MAHSRAVSSVISIVLVVAITVVLAATLSVFVLELGEGLSEPAPNADFRIEYEYFGDGVSKNDSIRITHIAGETLERERLEVVVGGDVVYNETGDSETTNQNFVVPGLVVEVDSDDDFNDLNKPCRVDGNRVSPAGTCGGPPGDSDGSDPGVTLQWAQEVKPGQTIVIQERNAPESYDVADAGDSIKLLHRGDDFSSIIARETVAPEADDDT